MIQITVAIYLLEIITITPVVVIFGKTMTIHITKLLIIREQVDAQPMIQLVCHAVTQGLFATLHLHVFSLVMYQLKLNCYPCAIRYYLIYYFNQFNIIGFYYKHITLSAKDDCDSFILPMPR